MYHHMAVHRSHLVDLDIRDVDVDHDTVDVENVYYVVRFPEKSLTILLDDSTVGGKEI